MTQIFISYRRDDSKWAASRIHDHICARFGVDQVFMDIATIEPGDDFVQIIERAISKAVVVIVIIGERWLTLTDAQGVRRLENPHDFVRLEVANGLKQNKRVIPVLLDDTRMPQPGDLPSDLDALARRHAITIRNEQFRDNAAHLIAALEKALDKTPQAIIAGQWKDMYSGTTTFFRQNNRQVVGFYDLGQGRKLGVYRGTIDGNHADLSLEWLEEAREAQARATLMETGKRIVGYWWYPHDRETQYPIDLHYISEELPSWLTDADFTAYAGYLR